MGGDDATTPDTRSAVAASARAAKLPSRYRILELIGEGGMGRVYRAHDSVLNRDVAVKLIDRELQGRDRVVQAERFAREARAAARLGHPNIVQVHDVDPEAGWLVMGLVDGKQLRDIPLPAPIPLVRAIAEQVLLALEAAHTAGVIHRDIKPGNILVGTDNHVTLVDFGVARLQDADLTQTGESIGTPAYMAPEQLRGGPTDARTDLYSLGATLYELVTGERLVVFETPSAASIEMVRSACGEHVALARLIENCLPADPAARFESASLALAALVDASDPRPVRHKSTRPQRRRWPWIVVAFAIGAAVTGAVALRPRGSPTRDPRIDSAFMYAQRGEHERAGQILDDFLGEHPTDPDALSLRVLTTWWDGTALQPVMSRAVDAPLSKKQRAMMRGIELITDRREAEAEAYLAGADREMPNTPEIVYLLGEALWHSQQIEAGAAMLERAFHLDPRWQVAIHHVIELALVRERAATLRPIADELRTVDAANAAALDCRIAIGERDYREAIEIAKAALEHDPIVEAHICHAQALVLTGDLAASARAAKRAFELWPIDLREWGGFSLHAEHMLYRGRIDEYFALVREKPSRQRTLALATLWPTSPDLARAEPTPNDRSARPPTPLGAAAWILLRTLAGHDEAATYNAYPEPEVRLFGQGLSAEARGDRETAIARYRAALVVPQRGDLHMLVSHHLARALDAAGDATGAAEACRGVLAPTLYASYRAVLWPDCVLWSGDRAVWQQLVDAWRDSTFAHPAVIEVKKRLAR